MAVSFKELYGAKLGSIMVGGPQDPAYIKQMKENLYQEAVQDYERLNSPTGLSSPNTLRPVTQNTLPKPTLSGGGGPNNLRAMDIGGGGYSGAIPSTSETPTSYTPPAATPFNLPAYDTGKVEGLAQRFAAPGVRQLRNTVQQVQQGVYDNPNVKRMTVRDALAGYGSGLESVMAGALKEGTNVYGQQYGAEVAKAGAEYGAGEARVLQREGILSSENMQRRGITSQEGMQARSLAATQAMHSESIASADRLAQYNNEWKAYLASLT